MLTKADQKYMKRLEGEGIQLRAPIDHAALLALPPLSRVAELMSHEYSNNEIADILGYSSAHSVNAAIQRIRRQLGPKAV